MSKAPSPRRRPARLGDRELFLACQDGNNKKLAASAAIELTGSTRKLIKLGELARFAGSWPHGSLQISDAQTSRQRLIDQYSCAPECLAPPCGALTPAWRVGGRSRLPLRVAGCRLGANSLPLDWLSRSGPAHRCGLKRRRQSGAHSQVGGRVGGARINQHLNTPTDAEQHRKWSISTRLA